MIGKEMGAASKILLSIGIIFICIMLGSLVLMSFVKSAGVDLTNLDSLSELNINAGQMRIVKIGFGLNHLLSFVLSGSILAMIFSNAKFVDYTGLNKVFDPKLLGNFLLLLVLIYPISAFLISLLQQVDLPAWASQMDDQNIEALSKLLKMESLLDYILNLVVIALLAGVGEELLFRGVIQKELSNYLSPAASILIGAFIFAAFHLEIMGFLPKFLIGLVLGYAYYASKTVLLPIIIHTLNNGLQVTLLYLGQDQIEKMTATSADEKIMWGGLIFIPLAFLYTRYIHNRLDGVDP